jgi:hypothetical protein
LGSPSIINTRFDEVLQDKAAAVYQTQSGRLAVVSPKNDRLAVIHPDGQRITVYNYTPTELKQLGAPLWTIKSLIT